MPENEIHPEVIAALLIEEHSIQPYRENWTPDEEKRVEHIVTTYVEDLDTADLVELIIHAEKETATVEEFIDTLCSKKKDSAGASPDWLTLLKAMASFILMRTLEANPVAIAA